MRAIWRGCCELPYSLDEATRPMTDPTIDRSFIEAKSGLFDHEVGIPLDERLCCRFRMIPCPIRLRSRTAGDQFLDPIGRNDIAPDRDHRGVAFYSRHHVPFRVLPPVS